MTDELALAAEFPAPTRDEWLALVDKVLKGGSFDRLITTTSDGIELQPLYTADMISTGRDESGMPGAGPHTRGAAAAPRPDGAWDVRAAMTHPDPEVANARALDELTRGATSLSTRFDRAFRHGVGPGSAEFDDLGAVDGVCVHDVDALDRTLEGVYLDLAAVHLEPGAGFVTAADWLSQLWRRRGVGGAEVSGSFGADPIGTLARDGVLPQGLDTALGTMAELAAQASDATPRMRAATIDLGAYAGAGATPAAQLGALLSTGVAYLRAMESSGMSIDAAAAQIDATIVLDAEFFEGIAFCRAARRVWASMLAECGVSTERQGLRLNVRTSESMMTRRDPWVNLLRVTSATFAGAVGGADAVTALPFDVALGPSDELGIRLARNSQLLLAEESSVGKVIDPAGGSWYVESFTEELAERGWVAFAGLESDGGMASALVDGSVAAFLDGQWSARVDAIATRRDAITGVSEFPLLAEEAVSRAPVDPESIRAAATGPSSHVEVTQGSASTVEPLPRRRRAAPFEALRDRADAYRVEHGHHPKVFLANLGPIAAHTARATWARNFYEAGGFEAVTNDGFTSAGDAAAAFEESGATVACLCSSDDVYADLAEDTARALTEHGAVRLDLAGRPGDLAGPLRAAGIGHFVHVGVDQVAELTSLAAAMGVTA